MGDSFSNLDVVHEKLPLCVLKEHIDGRMSMEPFRILTYAAFRHREHPTFRGENWLQESVYTVGESGGGNLIRFAKRPGKYIFTFKRYDRLESCVVDP